MADDVFKKEELLAIIKESFDYIDHKLNLIIESLGGGEFVFLKDNIDIVNSRMDELEKQVRAMHETNFGAAEILGFFLAPLVGNLLIQPAFNSLFDRVFRRLGVNKLMAEKLSNLADAEHLKSYKEELRKVLTEEFDLSGINGSNKLSYLYGALTKETVGGALNDSSQNIVSFIANYEKNKTSLETKTSITRRSVMLATMMAVTKADFEKTKKNMVDAHKKITDEISKDYPDSDFIGGESELITFAVTLKNEMEEIKKENLSDSDFSKNIIIHTNNFLFLSFLGDADLGEIEDFADNDIDADSTGGTGGGSLGYTRFTLRSNINKPILDYLLRNFPNEEESLILKEVYNPDFPLFKPEGKDFGSKVELIQYWVDYYINNPTEGKTTYKNYSREVSTYDRAADKLNTLINNIRPEMSIISNSLITNVSTLSKKIESSLNHK